MAFMKSLLCFVKYYQIYIVEGYLKQCTQLELDWVLLLKNWVLEWQLSCLLCLSLFFPTRFSPVEHSDTWQFYLISRTIVITVPFCLKISGLNSPPPQTTCRWFNFDFDLVWNSKGYHWFLDIRRTWILGKIFRILVHAINEWSPSSAGQNHLGNWKKENQITISDPSLYLQIVILRGWWTEIYFKQTSLNILYQLRTEVWEYIICYLSQYPRNETTKTHISNSWWNSYWHASFVHIMCLYGYT